MSFKPYTEKIKEKKIGICSILGLIRIQTGPGSGSIIPEADPDPHQHDTDPKHWIITNKITLYLLVKMYEILNLMRDTKMYERKKIFTCLTWLCLFLY